MIRTPFPPTPPTVACNILFSSNIVFTGSRIVYAYVCSIVYKYVLSEYGCGVCVCLYDVHCTVSKQRRRHRICKCSEENLAFTSFNRYHHQHQHHIHTHELYNRERERTENRYTTIALFAHFWLIVSATDMGFIWHTKRTSPHII